ncbi:hypothetical protein [Amycolatopsis magusensis]|uniref:hypothetical protein n=1 Tax=Amycolatopsis magusensis TaxID=882444 RepID=UPI0037ADC152
MAGARSVRQEQRELAARPRAERKTWAEVAAIFCTRYGVNIRAALRMVRDWSQRDAADQWNERWPADSKTFKNFSYWELWPAPTGHAPSLDVLARLAELYECSISDLVSDCADFRSRDPIHREAAQLANLSRIAVAELSPAPREDAGPDVDNLIRRLELIDVHELARLTAAWSDKLGSTASRRSLLLKLSAGLSLAAASPGMADASEEVRSAEPTIFDGYSGIWHSRCIYPSTGRDDQFVGEHYVAIRQSGGRLVGQSLPHSKGSKLRLELAVESSVATGSWRETTSPRGYYKGATYHGTLQMVIDPNGRRMRGMRLGFGREFSINSGQWELSLEENSISAGSQRPYHGKV